MKNKIFTFLVVLLASTFYASAQAPTVGNFGDAPTWYYIKMAKGGYVLTDVGNGSTLKTKQACDGYSLQQWRFERIAVDTFKIVNKQGRNIVYNGTTFKATVDSASKFFLVNSTAASPIPTGSYLLKHIIQNTYVNQYGGAGYDKDLAAYNIQNDPGSALVFKPAATAFETNFPEFPLVSTNASPIWYKVSVPVLGTAAFLQDNGDNTSISTVAFSAANSQQWRFELDTTKLGFRMINKGSSRQTGFGGTYMTTSSTAPKVISLGSLSAVNTTYPYLYFYLEGAGAMNRQGGYLGVYNVITDNGNSFKFEKIQPDVIVDFTLTPGNPNVFTNASNTLGGATVSSYAWNFDLSPTSTGTATPSTSSSATTQNVTYDQTGFYKISLTATFDSAGNTRTRTTTKTLFVLSTGSSLATPTAAAASTDAKTSGAYASETGSCSGNEGGTDINATPRAVYDNDLTTYWHSAYGTCTGVSAAMPQYVTIDLGSTQSNITGLYLVTRNNNGNDRPNNYQIFAGNDSTTLTSVVTVTTGTTYDTLSTSPVQLAKVLYMPSTNARFIKLLVNSSTGGSGLAVIAELKAVLGATTWGVANVNFNVNRVATEGKINFTTTEENGVASYQVQKQVNGNWATIATLSATGAKAYSFTDKALVNGSNNYKIVTVNVNGKTESTEVKGFNYNSLVKLSVYPNPAKGVVTVSFNDVKDRVITISDLSGKLVKKQVATGANTKVDVSNMAKGMYILAAEGATTKLIVE